MDRAAGSSGSGEGVLCVVAGAEQRVSGTVLLQVDLRIFAPVTSDLALPDSTADGEAFIQCRSGHFTWHHSRQRLGWVVTNKCISNRALCNDSGPAMLHNSNTLCCCQAHSRHLPHHNHMV